MDGLVSPCPAFLSFLGLAKEGTKLPPELIDSGNISGTVHENGASQPIPLPNPLYPRSSRAKGMKSNSQSVRKLALSEDESKKGNERKEEKANFWMWSPRRPIGYS